MIGHEQGHLCSDVGGGKAGESHVQISEKSSSRWGSRQCKGPEVGTFLGFEEYQGGLCGQGKSERGGYVGGENREVISLGGQHRVLGCQLSSKLNCVPGPALLGDLREGLHLCEPQFLHLQNGDENSCSTEVVGSQ